MRAGLGSFACLAAVLAAQGQHDGSDAGADPAQLVEQLRGDGCAAAHAQLVALGAAAVPALTAGLGAAGDKATVERLRILREIGPAAGSAAPAIFDRFVHVQFDEQFAEWMRALADLAPFRPDDGAIALLPVVTAWSRIPDRYSASVPQQIDMARLMTRLEFDRHRQLDDLIVVARSRRSLRAEVAIDLLGCRGAAARAAVPALREVLERPDPLLVGTERSLPLRAAAARAILAIDPAGAAAERARAVLAGAPPEPEAKPAVPERAQARARELVAQLADASQRAGAAENLVALGGWVSTDVATLLTADQDLATRAAALTVLTRLGPEAAAAVPQLFLALRELPTSDTLAVLAALTETAPASRDVVSALACSFSGGGRFAIFGRELRGTVDTEFCRKVRDADLGFQSALEVEPDAPLSGFRAWLGNDSVRVRERALVVLKARGAAARPLLPDIGDMMSAAQPNEGPFERDGIVHRLAAAAVLAIAEPDDPLVARAQQVLRATEPPK